jgi:hypothetical protein
MLFSLTQNENLNQLISYVVTLPSDENGERLRFKFVLNSLQILILKTNFLLIFVQDIQQFHQNY